MKPILASQIRVPLVDLLMFKCGRRFGVEIKRMDAPSLTGSMRIALANLQLAHLRVVYLGKQSFMSWCYQGCSQYRSATQCHWPHAFHGVASGFHRNYG
jgi:hypothetical protein